MNTSVSAAEKPSVLSVSSPPQTRRALPGWAVDRIRTGVPGNELRAHGGSRAVYGALVSTAMSAIQAGHDWCEWHAAVTSAESRLGQQARLDNRRRDIGRARQLKSLESAWNRAESRIADSPAFTSDEVRRRARGLLDRSDMKPWTATSSEADRLVYRHAVAEAEQRGHTRPVLPIRGISEATGVPSRTAARSLHRLTVAGLLRLHRRGRRSAGTSRRAGIYVVVELTLPNRPLPVNGPYVPLRQNLMCHPEAGPVPLPEETPDA